MAILSNVFGGDNEQNQSNDADGSVAGMLDSATDLGVDYQTNSSDTNEDGETSSSSNDGSLGTDLNTDSLLGGAGQGSSDSMSESDSDQGGVL
jgi:hypothetical protein